MKIALRIISAFVFMVMPLSVCADEVISEKWIGHYMYTGSDIKFPLHIEITIKGKEAHGVAFDGSMEKATVSGTVANGMYVLLLHPVKHGNSTNQDVYYKGKRVGNTINGKWEHVVGVSGPWTSSITNLGPEEAIEKYKLPCEVANIDANKGCGNGA